MSSYKCFQIVSLQFLMYYFGQSSDKKFFGTVEHYFGILCLYDLNYEL